jgi:FkbM family methyltransferase
MTITYNSTIPIRLQLAKNILRFWPLGKGRGRLMEFMLYKFEKWPVRTSFRFKFGNFIDAPIAPWPKGYRDLFLFGVMDTNELAIWSKVLKPGNHIVDAGANWGYWSLAGAYFVGPRGRVHAFEPVPTTSVKLRRNISASNVNNIIVHESALSNVEGFKNMYLALNDPISGNSSFGKLDGYEISEKIQAQTVILDNVLTYEPIDLIKLDIEGGELAALKGSTKILQRKEKPIITFEWNRLTSSAMGYDPTNIRDFLALFGYQLYVVENSKLTTFVEHTSDYLWIPMVWALTDKHKEELSLTVNTYKEFQ